MAICPINNNLEVSGPCKLTKCYNNVPTLDFHCLRLHEGIYNKSTSDILYSLYGKGYKMMVAMAIKASRIAYTTMELQPCVERKLSKFEKSWIGGIVKAGPLNPSAHWTDIARDNVNYLLSDRMLQVLNTMEVYEFSLKDVLTEYKRLFSTIDLTAFALKGEEEAVNNLLRSG